jgi:hypothetical protein
MILIFNLELVPQMIKDLLSTGELVPKEVMNVIVVLSLELLLGQIMI